MINDDLVRKHYAKCDGQSLNDLRFLSADEEYELEQIARCKLTIKLVCGWYVRSYKDVGFTGGMHWLEANGYIPEGEEWIEAPCYHRNDRIAIAVHESNENYDMRVLKYHYDKAHRDSEHVEQMFRKRTDKVPAPLKTEGD